MIGPITIYLRRHIPKSPRWMVTYRHAEAAEEIVAGIERDIQADGKQLPHIDESQAMWIKAKEGFNPQRPNSTRTSACR